MTDRTVPAEKIEEMIARLDSEADIASKKFAQKRRLLHAERADNYRLFADFLRALLPPPPLVIEPGRWYRTRDGRKAFVIEASDKGVRGFLDDRDGGFVLYEWVVGGTVWDDGDPAIADIIAPWEDTPDAD